MAEPYLNFVHPEDVERTCQEIARATGPTPCTTRYENRLRTRDGVWRWLLWSARWDGEQWSRSPRTSPRARSSSASRCTTP